jgi:hypothetical protein
MAWPKGQPRPEGWNTTCRASNQYKECGHCGESVALSEFPYAYWRKGWKKKKATDPEKYADNCKECRRYLNAVESDPEFKADRARRRGRPRKGEELTPQQKKERQNEYKQKVRRNTRIMVLRYLHQKGCECCGCKDPRVLEFDHLDPKKKKASIAVLISQGYSWANEKLRREIRKCRVLCANCHRLHTIEQQGYYQHDDVKSELDSLLQAARIDT